MNFTEAIKSVFINYFNFNDRACRAEFWWFTLFAFLVSLFASYVDAWVFGSDFWEDTGPLEAAWSLGTFIPGLSVGARRLHDIDKSGWWQLLVFIPIIGWILLLYWFCVKGGGYRNRFGDDPLAPLGADVAEVFR